MAVLRDLAGVGTGNRRRAHRNKETGLGLRAREAELGVVLGAVLGVSWEGRQVKTSVLK